MNGTECPTCDAFAVMRDKRAKAHSSLKLSIGTVTAIHLLDAYLRKVAKPFGEAKCYSVRKLKATLVEAPIWDTEMR